MAKDPAFLLYSKDFYEGTRMMLPEERACYLDLMIYQHQNGNIPSDLRRVLMYCSGIDEATLKATLKAKFKQKEDGTWQPIDDSIRFRPDDIRHYNFKGIYDSHMKIRQSPAYRKFKKSVLIRDGKKCKQCGSLKNLHVHHLKRFSTNPELRFEVSNGLTLCQKCHINIHKNE